MKSNQAIQEMQILEQNLQQILLQKQAFQLELSETQAALKEVKNSDGEVFKIVGQLMLKTDRKKMQDELLEKEKILEMRLKAMEKQEKQFTERANTLREEVMKSMKEKK